MLFSGGMTGELTSPESWSQLEHSSSQEGRNESSHGSLRLGVDGDL